MNNSTLLDIETYNSAEAAASDRFPIRVNQAFFPEMFASVGYPARVERPDQLWRYIDVMHEARTTYNMDHLLHGLTDREFELFKDVTRIVDTHATKHYGRRAHATSALLRAIHVLRLIKLATGDERPAVLEVGPGCGYLGMLLVMEGYPYISTDVTQAFYLYQSHLMSYVAKDFKELAVDDGDITTLEAPKPGTAIHVPWWKWVTLTPEKIKLSVGIMTCNHCLCEMHPGSLGYLASVSSRILANQPGGGQFVFDSWGYDLLHSEMSILAKFSQFGYRLCHNEPGVSGMALAAFSKDWPVYGHAAPPPPSPDVPAPPHGIIGVLNRYPALKKFAQSVVNSIPGLRLMLVRILYPQQAAAVELAEAEASGNTHVPNFKADNPLSKKLTDDRRAVAAQAKARLPELQAFLKAHFEGTIPDHPDEVFFKITSTVY
jgi:hypothetical protein